MQYRKSVTHTRERPLSQVPAHGTSTIVLTSKCNCIGRVLEWVSATSEVGVTPGRCHFPGVNNRKRGVGELVVYHVNIDVVTDVRFTLIDRLLPGDHSIDSVRSFSE